MNVNSENLTLFQVTFVYLQRSLHLSALADRDVHLGLVVGAHGGVLNLSHHQHAVNHPAEHDVLVVQEVALGGGDEKLAAVRVL